MIATLTATGEVTQTSSQVCSPSVRGPTGLVPCEEQYTWALVYTFCKHYFSNMAQCYKLLLVDYLTNRNSKSRRLSAFLKAAQMLGVEGGTPALVFAFHPPKYQEG
jgi:hypothetical protein